MQGMVRGERIAAPVCGLVRNDMIGGLSHSPTPFIRANACVRVDVGIDPYEIHRTHPVDRRADRVVRPYEKICEAASTPTKCSPLCGETAG